MIPRDETAAAILEGLFTTANEGIVLLDKHNRILRANPEFLGMFGYEESEVLGANLDDRVASPEKRSEAEEFSRRSQRGERIAVEAVRTRKNGTPIDVSILSFPIIFGGRAAGFGAIYLDISHSRSLENSLRMRLDLESEVGAICQEFISEPDFDKAVDFALERIGRLFDADKSFFLRWANPGGKIENFLFWLREGVAFGPPLPTDLNANNFPWWLDRLQSGEIFELADASSLPPEAVAEKTLLSGLDAAEMTVFPVFLENRPTGFIGVVNAKRRFLGDKTSLRLLNIAAQVIGSALGRKRVEDALRESTRRYEALFNHSNDGVFILDLQDHHLAVNERAASMLGYGPDELIGKSTRLVIDPAEQGNAEAKKKFLLSGEAPPLYERTFRKKDGTPLLVEINLSLVRDEEGRPLHIQSIVRDISGRKKSEAALRESEEKYRNLIDRANDGIVIIQDGCLIFTNPRILEMTGFTREISFGKPFTEFISAREVTRIAEFYRRRMAGDTPSPIYETLIRNADGTDLPVELNAGLISFEGRPADLIFIRDISERRLSSARLIQAMKNSIAAMAAAMEKRDPYTAGHQNRVTELALAIAREMKLDPIKVEGLHIAGLVHDIGKLSIPSEILSKPGRLTSLEFSLIQIHPEAGYDILKGIEFPWPVADIVLQHHEKIDGSGYPHGLKGEAILLESRILSVADVVEAMSTHRPYRPALGLSAALEEISNKRGTHFDPDVVDACIRALGRDENRALFET